MPDAPALAMLIGFVFGAAAVAVGGWFGARLVWRLHGGTGPILRDVAKPTIEQEKMD